MPKKDANPASAWTPVDESAIDSAWQPVDEGGASPAATTVPPPQPSLLQRAANAGAGLLSGIGGGAIGLMSTGDEWAQKHLPSFLTRSDFGFGKPVDEAAFRSKYVEPHSTAERIGNAAEKATEFLIPGEAEETAARMAPKLIQPAVRIGAGALSAGAVNKAQGGKFGTGALLGAGGAAAGEGLRLLAPKMAEAALHITPRQRAFGKTAGEAALEDTRGMRPDTIANSARESIGRHKANVAALTDAASVEPAPPIRGFLMPPTKEIPLGKFEPDAKGELIPAAHFPQENVGEARVIRNKKGQILSKAARKVEFPESKPPARISPIRGRNGAFISSEGMTPEGPGERPLLPVGRDPNNGRMLPRTPTRSAFMTSGTREAADLPRSGPGVLISRPEMSASVPPAEQAARHGSLVAARGEIQRPLGQAAREGAATRHGQLNQMLDFLHRNPVTGEEYPARLTARELNDIKNGFGDEHLSFNPERHEEAEHAGRQAYHQIKAEHERLVPQAKAANQRISSLIEVMRNAEKESRQAGTGQRLLGRFGAHTGALAGGLTGAYYGGQHGGAAGAVKYGLAGALLPELIASPEVQMKAARMMHNAKTFRPLVGAALASSRRPIGTRGRQP